MIYLDNAASTQIRREVLEIINNELKLMVDLKKFEILILFSLVVPIIFFGFYPEPLINSIEVSVENLLNSFNTNIQTNLAYKN